jgi:hypothetical protein
MKPKSRLFRKRMPAGLREISKNLREGEAGRAVTSATQPTPTQSPISGDQEAPNVPAIGAHTEIQTIFTKPGENFLLYSAEGWVRVRFLLETAGPVSVSTRQDILPTLSGKGILLTTGVERVFELPKGDRIFIAASSVNRVQFSVEPFAWQEQQTLLNASVLQLLKKLSERG